MRITEQDWDQLEADRHADGTTVRRVYPRSPHDIFIAVRHPDGSRMLTLGVGTRAAGEALRRLHALPRTRGLEMQFARLDDGSGELRVALTDNDLREVFNPLASDIASTAQAETRSRRSRARRCQPVRALAAHAAEPRRHRADAGEPAAACSVS